MCFAKISTFDDEGDVFLWFNVETLFDFPCHRITLFDFPYHRIHEKDIIILHHAPHIRRSAFKLKPNVSFNGMNKKASLDFSG